MRTWSSLKSAQDFRANLSHGRRYRSAGMTVTVSRTERGDPPRLGLAVKAPSAVDRNRVKRRLRAAADLVELPAGTVMVVSTGAHTAHTSFQFLVDGLSGALREASW